MSSIIFIDESGDAGISTIRAPGKAGSSDYFTMGAVLLQPAGIISANKLLDRLQEDFKKTKRWRHATDLSHGQRVHFCKEATKLHARFFGVISYKPTLGGYAGAIDWEPDKFYNKCAKYLLEKIGAYLSHVDPCLSEPRIVFENRNHDYGAMIRYLEKVKEKPLYTQSKALDRINPFGITSKEKGKEEVLRIADLVSYSLYSCVNKTPENFGNTESRYLRELAPRFAADEKGRVLHTGIKCIHKVEDLNLDTAISKELAALRAMPRPT